VHRFSAVLSPSTNKLWTAHLPVPPAIVEAITHTGSRRVRCTFNGTATTQCALVAYRRGQWVVTINQRLRQSLRLTMGDRVQVEMRPDASPYGHAMPAELAETLRQNAEGRRYFKALTLGRQRTLLYIVNAVKDPVKRAHRSAVIVRHLCDHQGVLQYRKLAEQLRTGRPRRS
jgi:hypothetical protein